MLAKRIVPCLDVQNGRVVKGVHFEGIHEVGDPVACAAAYEAQGADEIVFLDITATNENRGTMLDVVRKTAERVFIPLTVGGGIRSVDDFRQLLLAGADKVSVNSAAVKNPQLVKDAVKEYGARIAVGIDAKNGFVATEGWLETSNVHFTQLAKAMSDVGVEYIIFTDISKDGTLSGVNVEQLDEINKCCKANIIASGGVHTIEDIVICKKLGLYGTICGKSIYSGSLDLAEAVRTAGN